MALTLNKLRFQLLEAVNLYSDDADFDYRLLDQYIQNKRVKWIEQVYNKFQKNIPNIYYQSIACIPMQLVDSSECCTETDCYVVRSVDKVPEILSLTDGELIARVSPIGLESISYTIISQFRIPYWGNSRFNKNKIAAVYYNGYIYLISKDEFYYPQIEKITLNAVFRDPKAAAQFIPCEDEPCWTEDSPYPLEERLWEYMKTDILATDFRIKMVTARDNTPDNQEEQTDGSPDTVQKR